MGRSRNKKIKGQSDLRILNFNINGLMYHQKTLLTQMVDNDYDVITLQETFTSSEGARSLKIPGYQKFPKDSETPAPDQQGVPPNNLDATVGFPPPPRGLVTYVKTSLKASKPATQPAFCDKGEFLTTCISTGSRHVKILNYYISPSFKPEHRNYDFSGFLSGSYIMAGDANADPARTDTAQGEHLYKALETHPFICLVNNTSPTNFTTLES